jgi:hypothetical protein
LHHVDDHWNNEILVIGWLANAVMDRNMDTARANISFIQGGTAFSARYVHKYYAEPVRCAALARLSMQAFKAFTGDCQVLKATHFELAGRC